ncbi:hypothetical protein PLICRDRAFT_679064 [Plicaturopsis crispa FD-325 SS-3]|nr:hypothetical protein PLICRDRAFT_679064 [Plicaturopsis crispa FD-325 SS-3]
MSKPPVQPSPTSDVVVGGIAKRERFWVQHYTWLEERGYRLRKRFAPDWIPSWLETNKLLDYFEDSRSVFTPQICDATRISDGAFVSLKKLSKSVHPFEVDIGRYFTSEPLASDPRNHCAPFIEVLQVPDDDDLAVVVMPLLRYYDNPRFDTFGEAVDFFQQVIEGLQFMHEHHVAHRDIKWNNVMMDATPLYPIPYHPYTLSMRRDYTGPAKHRTRTQHPVKYYFIDFGISRRYNPADGPPLEDPIWGGDKTVPEFHKALDPCDPFPTDIYYLGNMIRQGFLIERYGFDFMRPLIEDMVQDDPSKRPQIDEVASRFQAIRASLSNWKLRSRIVKKGDDPLDFPLRVVRHWARRISFILRRVPAVPSV